LRHASFFFFREDGDLSVGHLADALIGHAGVIAQFDASSGIC